MAKIIIILGSLVLMAMLAVSPAVAREWFVNDTYPGAHDANAGTKERPFKTISMAVSQARAGDTVWIFAGTYRETITLQTGGLPGKTLAIRANPGNLVIIKGSDLVHGWRRHSGSVWNRPNWEVDSQQVFVDGQPLQQIGAHSPLHHQVIYDGKPNLPAVGKGMADMFPGSFWYEKSSKNLYIWLKDSTGPDPHEIEVSVRNWIMPPVDGVNNIELDGLNFSHSNQTSQGLTMGLVNICGNSWVVSHCKFTYGDFSGLHITGEHHRIVNNTANYNGNTGMGINGSDMAHNWRAYLGRYPQNIVLENNETSYNNSRNFYRHWHAGGIKAGPSCNGVTISRHRAVGNQGPGIWFDGWCNNNIIDRCYVSRNTVGIFYEISDKATITNNLITDNSEQGIYVSSSSEVNVYNNTLANNWASMVLHGISSTLRSEHPALNNNKMFNNIIYNSKAADLVIYANQSVAINNFSDYNLYFSPGGDVKIAWTSTPSYRSNYRNLEKFSTFSGLESHSQWADPKFANISAGDYTLEKISPAIGAGTTAVRELGDQDLAGNQRVIKGSIDLGAYEYQGER